MGVQPPEAPGENIRSIGRRCRRGDAHSRAVLIGRDAWPYCRSRLFFLYRFRRSACPSAAGLPGVREGADFRHDNMPVAMAGRKYPFPFRTRKSSSPAPMILLTGESRWPPAFFSPKEEKSDRGGESRRRFSFVFCSFVRRFQK